MHESGSGVGHSQEWSTPSSLANADGVQYTGARSIWQGSAVDVVFCRAIGKARDGKNSTGVKGNYERIQVRHFSSACANALNRIPNNHYIRVTQLYRRDTN